MRKLRIFIVELILVGILVAWIFEKFPTAVDKFIPWIGFLVLWHLTWEIGLEPQWTRTKARLVFQRLGRMAWIIAFIFGGLVSIVYFYSVRVGIEAIASSKGNAAQPPALNPYELKLKIDRLFPLWGYKNMIVKSGVPIAIPRGAPPTDEDSDTYLAVVGTILNARDVQASASYWEMTAHLVDGRSVTGELLAPSNDLVITYPSNSKPDVLSVRDYWPRKMDMQTIPAHGVSYGFVFGVLKGVTPSQFDKPNTSVTVCFRDAEDRSYCDTITRNSD